MEEKKEVSIKEFRLLFRYFKNKKLQFIIYIFLTLLNFIPYLFTALIWGFALEALLKNQFQEFVYIIIAYESIQVIFHSLIYNIRAKLYKTLELEFISHVSKDLYRKVDQLPAVAFEEMGVGEFTNRITQEPEQILSLLDRLIYLVVEGLVSIVVVFIAFYISIVLGLEVLLFALVMGVMSYRVFPKIKKVQKELRKESDQSVKFATENISGIREVKALGMKENTEKKLFHFLDNIYKKRKESSNYEVNYYSWNNAIYFILQGVIFATCGYFVVQGKIAYSIFIMFETMLWRVDSLVESLSDFGINYNKVAVSLNRLNEILENKLYPDEQYGTRTLKHAEGKIKFQDVKFKYKKDEDYVLAGVNMTLLPHRKIAIVGRSGNGKSTIFNLLLRYFDATEGKIFIDDIPIEELTEKSLRSNISIIRQSPFLFNLSVIDNFKLVKPNTTLKEIREVCKKAYIDEYIMSLPKQYDTIIGEGGVNLSGGQKQRIAIARTLLLDTKIILFDEATSALDNESQSYIQKTMNELVKDHTVIIVAHRLSTIMDADEIYVIQKGKVEGCGTHQELLKNNHVYQTLYQSESSSQVG